MRNNYKKLVKIVNLAMSYFNQYLLYFEILIVSIQSINHD